MGQLFHLHFGLEAFIGPVLYAGAALAFLLAIFKDPAIGLYVLIPLLPMQTIRYRLHQYPLGHSFIDLLLLAVTIGLIVRRQPVLPRVSLRALLLVTAAFTYIVLWKGSAHMDLPAPLWFNDQRLADWKNNVVVPIAIYFVVCAAIRTPRQMKILLLLIGVSTLLFNRSIYSVVSQRDYSSFSSSSRAETGGIAANGLAALEVQLGFFLMGLVSGESRRLVRWSYVGLALFCFYCVIFSFSRGAYLAFLGAWLFLGVVRMRKLLPLFVVFLLVWEAIVPNAVRERVFMTYDRTEGFESSAGARITVWQDAVDVFRVDPVFGVGYLTYSYMHRVGGYTDTHNLYMKVLVETGVVGLFLFVFLLWRLYRLGWRLFRSSEDAFLSSLGLGFALWMVCAVLTNVFGDRWNYIQINGYMWTFAALAEVGNRLGSEDCETEESELEEEIKTLREAQEAV